MGTLKIFDRTYFPTIPEDAVVELSSAADCTLVIEVRGSGVVYARFTVQLPNVFSGTISDELPAGVVVAPYKRIVTLPNGERLQAGYVAECVAIAEGENMEFSKDVIQRLHERRAKL